MLDEPCLWHCSGFFPALIMVFGLSLSRPDTEYQYAKFANFEMNRESCTMEQLPAFSSELPGTSAQQILCVFPPTNSYSLQTLP